MGETSGSVPCIDGQKQEKGAFTWHDTLVIQPSIALIAVLFSLSGISSRKKATRNPRVSCRRCGVAVLFISSYLKLLDCYFKIGLCTDKRTSSKKKETRNPVALQKLIYAQFGFFSFPLWRNLYAYNSQVSLLPCSFKRWKADKEHFFGH